jgi:hypothetical protein
VNRNPGIAMALTGLAVALWVAPLLSLRATYGARTTADEPQYLLTAISLGEDLSLDISDELADERSHDFHEATLPQQTKVQDDGSRISPHDPLLPAFLAIPVLVGGWVGAKLALAALAGGLAAAMVWVAVQRFAVPLGIAVLTVCCFSLAAPLAMYGVQIYPELPAALAVTIAIGALTGALRTRGLVVLGAAVVALPWLSVKYLPVAAALVAVAVARLWMRGDRRPAFGLLAALGGAGLLYAGLHQLWYGGWTVYAAGDHFVGGELTAAGHNPNYLGRARRLTGLITDRGFGLAAWQPAFLLVVPALVALLRRRPAGYLALVAPLAAGWFTATFVALTMHGYWWPGRQVVVVLPTLVIAVSWWAARYQPARVFVGAGIVAGAFMVAWLAVETWTGGIRLIIDFESTTNPLYRLWRVVLPDDRLEPAGTDLLRALCLAVFGVLAAWGWRSVRSETGKEHTSWSANPSASSRSQPAPSRSHSRPPAVVTTTTARMSAP